MKRIFLAVLAVLLAMQAIVAQQTPEQFLKVKVGADRVLVNYPDICRYFEHLAATSKRFKWQYEGQSTLKNKMGLAFISSAANIANLPRLLEINKQLANPDSIDAITAKALTDEGKLFVLLTCSIHASEIGASQMALTLAHKLASSNDEAIQTWLDKTVVMLMPSLNPDGTMMIVDWYKKYLGTPFEGGNMPYLYHHYAGHDNNRDHYMLNLAESKVLAAILHSRYFPQVFLDLHQMGNTGPRMFVPPFKDPVNPNLSPLMLRECEVMGGFMAYKLQQQGMSGVGNGYGFDAYWPGGTKNTAWFKNVVGLLTEMASVKVASPVTIDANELEGGGKGLPENKPQVNFPQPWPGGLWRLSDIMAYEQVACEALIEVCAQNKNDFLYNFYRMGKENLQPIVKGPSAYIVPADQWDKGNALTMLARLQEGGVRIYQSTAEIRTHERSFAKGSYLIPLAQPYGAFVKVMMEKQIYPEIHFMDDGPIMEPYDAVGWTLPLQMGVEAVEIDRLLSPDTLELLPPMAYPKSEISGSGKYYILPGRQNRSFLVVNRLLKQGIPLARVSVDGSCAAGDFVVKQADVSEKILQEALAGSGVSIRKGDPSPKEIGKTFKAPRIAIYQGTMGNPDEGWTRWILDHYQFDYKIARNADFKDAASLAKIDVIVFASQSREAIVDGPTDKNDVFPRLPIGYKGGIGVNGIQALKAFLADGGKVVLLDNASELGRKDLELPFRSAIAEGDHAFSCPGSLLAIQVDNRDPLAWGMPDNASLFFSGKSAFLTSPPNNSELGRQVVARFASRGPHLLSGYIKGENVLDNAVAAMRFPYRKGQVIVLGGRVQHRAQTYGTFKFLFNALFLQ